MIHEYIDATEEYVKISRENYDGIKDGYDSGYKHASDETLEVIEDLEDRNEKLLSAVCVIKIKKIDYTYDHELISIENEADIGPTLKNYFDSDASLSSRLSLAIEHEIELRDRIEKFQSSFIGKLLNFFGVKL